jgi:hypothetical protein
MDYLKRPLASLILLAVTGLATPTIATPDIRAEQQKLNDFRSLLGTLQREEAELLRQIADKQRELEVARNRPSPEQAELTTTRKLVEQARSELRANPSPENEAKLKNAEFKLTLAERKLASANSEVAALTAQLEQLERQLASRQSQISGVNQQIAAQASANAELEQRLARERQQREQQSRELEQSRREAEAAQKEIERLKAMLAAREASAAAAAKSAAAAPAAAKPAQAAATAAPAPAAAPAPVPAPAAATPTPAAKPAAPAGGTTDIAKLTTQSEVLATLQGLEQRLSGTELKRGERPVNQILHLKQMQGGREVGKSRITMHALGNGQFRGEEDVKPGTYQLVVGLKYWEMAFGANESGRFVFLLDESNEGAPQLRVYRKALEGG